MATASWQLQAIGAPEPVDQGPVHQTVPKPKRKGLWKGDPGYDLRDVCLGTKNHAKNNPKNNPKKVAQAAARAEAVGQARGGEMISTLSIHG